MKKKIKWIAGIALSVLIVTGLVFCYLRPAHVREAWDILFKNELTVQNISRQNGIDDPGQGPRDREKEESGEKPDYGDGESSDAGNPDQTDSGPENSGSGSFGTGNMNSDSREDSGGKSGGGQ